MLLRRHSRPKALGKESTEEMSNFLGLFFMSFTAGNLIFDKIILDDIFNYNWIAFIIAGVCYFSPQRWIVSCFHRTSGDVINLQKYDDIKYTFISVLLKPLKLFEINNLFFRIMIERIQSPKKKQ